MYGMPNETTGVGMEKARRKQPLSITVNPEALRVIREFLGDNMSISSFFDIQLCSIADYINETGYLDKSKNARTLNEFLAIAAHLMDQVAVGELNSSISKQQVKEGAE